MAKISFSAVIEIRGINPFVHVSAARADALRPGWRRPMPVLVRIDGKPARPHRVNMMPAGDGRFYLYLNEIVRHATAASVGDRVTVEIEWDPDYRGGPQHLMPAWFKNALGKNSKAQENWELLTPSRKKEILRYFARLKSSETRSRNLSKALRVLSGERGRFLAREWKNGK